MLLLRCGCLPAAEFKAIHAELDRRGMGEFRLHPLVTVQVTTDSGKDRFAAGIRYGVRLLRQAPVSARLRCWRRHSDDPAKRAAVSALLCTIAALACRIPARRASRVGPIAVLRAPHQAGSSAPVLSLLQ